MNRTRDEHGNGCLILVLVVVAVLLVSCIKWAKDSSEENEEWCDSVESFWADGNEHDSGLDDEYAFQCRN